jgi:hypothetical protein
MNKKKKPGIQALISDLDDVKKKQILAEIRSIKIQSAIAILSVIGSAVAFIVIQQQSIKKLFETNPKLVVRCNDPFLKRAAKIKFVSTTNAQNSFESDLKNIDEEIEIPPGAYASSLTFEGKEIWTENFIMEMNKSQIITLPEFFNNKINVYAKPASSAVKPGGRIDVDINSSGNGFLWVYELTSSQEIKLLFPSDSEINSNVHQVLASAPFQFPEDVYLAAGTQEQKEKYIFMVTSINNPTYAHEMVTSLYGNEIDKGVIQSIDKNWGLASVEIDVVR